MVDYRFDQPDPVGSMARGYALGSQIRQGSNDQKYAKAASDEERARLANEAGDFARAEAFKKRVDAQSERDWQVGQRRLQVMQNLGNRLLSVPYEQRKATLEQWKPSILQNFPMFTAEQIDALDPTDEWIRGELAQAGQMGEYVKLEKGQRGEIIGYKADGSVVTVRDAAPEVGVSPSGVAYVQNADGTVQVKGNVPGYAVPRGGDADGRPKLSKDYRYNEAGDAEPVPGSPAALKLAESKRKADLMMQQLEGGAANVARAVATATKLAENDANTGLWGSLMSNVPGGGQHDLAAAIETIQANLGFDKLTQMRASSPTGGALGATSDREIGLLSAVVANLKQSQTPAQFRANLAAVATQYRNTLAAIKEAYATDYSGAGTAAPSSGGVSVYGEGDVATVTSQEEYDALEPGTVYRDATGQTKRKR